MGLQKYKYLIKNVGALTISNFGTKILSFLLIPFYTSILSTTEYGIYDIYVSTVSLLIPILTLNIVDSMMRYALEKNTDQKQVFMIGFRQIILATIIIAIIDFVNFIFEIIPIYYEYSIYFFLLFMGSILYSMMTQFIKGLEKIVDIAISGAISSISLIIFNIVFLLVYKMGLEGYFAASCLAYYVPCIYLIFKIKIWKYINFDIENKLLKKEMFGYSIPLIFNTIAWWINNVSDRYIVTWLCGVATNGIYSVAYKIPSILNVFQSIFSQAWTISAIKEFDKKNCKFYCEVYSIYNCGMVIVCSILLLSNQIMAKILFSKEFYNAWEYAPYLMISVVFGSLSGMLGGIFSAAKRTNILTKTTMAGTAINTLLNIVLVYFLGPVGAAIATLCSYILVWIARVIETNKILSINIMKKRDGLSYLILLAQSVIWELNIAATFVYLCEIIGVILVLALYLDNIKKIKNKVFNNIIGNGIEK